MKVLLKDAGLAELAEHSNVAQFASFSAGAEPTLRFSRIRGHQPDLPFRSVRDAIQALLQASDSGAVNVRSFLPERLKGNPFVYRLTSADDVMARLESLGLQGYFSIVNETVDTDDGGVSGVVAGGIIEFTPFDTPRGVERPGVASLPFQLGYDMLSVVYGFSPDIRQDIDKRIEFSIHPLRVGYRHGHTLLWECERVTPQTLTAAAHWPNRFSQLIGDKVFGLLLAHLLGIPVPTTTVFPRAIAPFQFGRPTGTAEVWMRTAPPKPRPGHFPTTFGWQDPYALLAKYDPENGEIASVLAQESVEPVYSGATLAGDEEDRVEGVAGRGDDFMVGKRAPEPIPERVAADVRALLASCRGVLGATEAEFVHDGRQPWIVQLHLRRGSRPGSILHAGAPASGWLDFDPVAGLDVLELLIAQAGKSGKGIRVTAPVGVTSHVGDLLRRSDIPARLLPREVG